MTFIRKPCPGCGGPLAIWHATIYRTFDPAELTEEKIAELNEWVKNTARPALTEILMQADESKENKKNECPHCGTFLIYMNQPVKRVRLV